MGVFPYRLFGIQRETIIAQTSLRAKAKQSREDCLSWISAYPGMSGNDFIAARPRAVIARIERDEAIQVG
jgi:hypothetical protein